MTDGEHASVILPAITDIDIMPAVALEPGAVSTR